VGRVDPGGTPRSLHVDHALAVTEFAAPRGDAHRDLVRKRGGAADTSGEARRTRYCGPDGPIVSTDLVVERLEGTGTISIESGLFRGLTVLEGTVTIDGDTPLVVPRGRSAAIPAGATTELTLDRAHAILSAVP